MTKPNIAIIGLGYVGLPLAVEFAKKYRVTGFDINTQRVIELKKGYDRTKEVDPENLRLVLLQELQEDHFGLHISDNLEDIRACTVYIITVPTPTDQNNRPVLTPLYKASTSVGKVLKKGDYVIYESTVYPGATEEDCVPILEKESGLTLNHDFFAGYSPERINPGDKEHTVTRILKVTSGSSPGASRFIDELYASIITAGTFKASSIKVAEAAKVIENAQRDINIAFVNELAKIFSRLDIDTHDVLEAAGTKWNFLPFKPGLVGGHCIGVDPYYLAQKAEECGYHPEIILAGRRLNNSMGHFIATEIIKLMLRKDVAVKNSRVLLMGITFKENCPDVRNTRAIDIYRELTSFNLEVDVYDPWADPDEILLEYGIISFRELPYVTYDCLVLAVAHRQFLSIPIKKLLKEPSVIYDVKGFLPREIVDSRL
ncbi:MAG TPA: nucleotide sugar dehydrogenase [Saprospiraceae bacterium]|nr:nucleotide sugar dehydrogenase [Saprospiraceae bacterium]